MYTKEDLDIFFRSAPYLPLYRTILLSLEDPEPMVQAETILKRGVPLAAAHVPTEPVRVC